MNFLMTEAFLKARFLFASLEMLLVFIYLYLPAQPFTEKYKYVVDNF